MSCLQGLVSDKGVQSYPPLKFKLLPHLLPIPAMPPPISLSLISHSGCHVPQTHYVTEDDVEFLVLLLLTSKD